MHVASCENEFTRADNVCMVSTAVPWLNRCRALVAGNQLSGNKGCLWPGQSANGCAKTVCTLFYAIRRELRPRSWSRVCAVRSTINKVYEFNTGDL